MFKAKSVLIKLFYIFLKSNGLQQNALQKLQNFYDKGL